MPQQTAVLVERSLRLLTVGAFVLLLMAGFFGDQGDWDSNLLPVTVWVIWWVGVTFISALLGGVWPLIDPWRAVGRLIAPRQAIAALASPRWSMASSRSSSSSLHGLELAWTENAMPRKLAAVIVDLLAADLDGHGALRR